MAGRGVRCMTMGGDSLDEGSNQRFWQIVPHARFDHKLSAGPDNQFRNRLNRLRPVVLDQICSLLNLPEFVAVRESGYDAVDGSSTGTRVPKMWALLRLPQFGGANHAIDPDNRSRHRRVGL